MRLRRLLGRPWECSARENTHAAAPGAFPKNALRAEIPLRRPLGLHCEVVPCPPPRAPPPASGQRRAVAGGRLNARTSETAPAAAQRQRLRQRQPNGETQGLGQRRQPGGTQRRQRGARTAKPNAQGLRRPVAMQGAKETAPAAAQRRNPMPLGKEGSQAEPSGASEEPERRNPTPKADWANAASSCACAERFARVLELWMPAVRAPRRRAHSSCSACAHQSKARRDRGVGGRKP